MAIYTVQGPDGKTYTVEGPDGATADQVGEYVMSQQTAPNAPPAAPSASAAPPTTGERIVRGLRDPIDGGAQLLTNLLPSGLVEAGNQANNWLADKTGLVGRLPQGGVDQQVREAESQYQGARGKDAGVDWMRILGNVASPANAAIAAGMPAAATIGGRIAVGAAGGAGSALMNPVTGEGGYAVDKGKQVAIGAAGGALVPAVTGALGRVVSPAASRNPDLQLLRSEGVRPTIGQSLGGKFNAGEEKLSSLPIMGDMISRARGNAMEDFNNAAINRAAGKVGGTVKGTGQAAVREAGDLLSKSYDDALGQIKFVKFDQQFAQDFGQLNGMAQNLTGPMRSKFNKTVSDILGDRVQGSGSLLGPTYKKVDSELGMLAARYGKSSAASEAELGDALLQLQSLLKQQAMRTNPQAAAAIKAADAGWANLVRVEGAAKAAHNAGGVFTPAQLNMAVRGADASTRGRAVARGTALLQDLGSAGQNVLGNKVPNSGTADRLMLGGAGLGAYFVNPAIPAGLIGGGALYTSPMQGLLSGAVAARPQSAKAVRDALLKASPGLVPAGAQMGLGLLDY